MSFTLRTLGTLGLERRGRWVRLHADSLGLLCLLRLSEHGRAGRSEAQALLWPGVESGKALDAAITAINRASEAPLITETGDGLRVDLSLLACDVELVAPASHPPEDRFLAGFDLPESDVFRAWAVAARSRVRATPGVAPAQKRLPRLGSAVLGAMGILGLVAVYLTRSTPPPGFEPGDPVALIAADDSRLSRAFVAAALQSLSQSDALTPFEATGPDRPALAAILAGAPAGETNRFSLVLTANGTDTLVAETSAGQTDEESLAAMDHLLAQLRRATGERPSERRGAGVGIGRLGTPSLAALADWATGNGALARGDRSAAREHWRAALALDSTFAWAHLSLADDAAGNGDPAVATRHYRAALARPERLTRRELARAESALAALGER